MFMNNKDTRELNIHVYMLLEEKWKGRTMQTIENLIHIDIVNDHRNEAVEKGTTHKNPKAIYSQICIKR
jgi:hypothetical protein